MVGTAAEVAPIRSVDRIAIGLGKPGPLTRKIQAEYHNIVTGKTQYEPFWLQSVHSNPERKPPQNDPAAESESVNA